MAIDLVDPSANKMVWKGVAEGVIPRKDTQLEETIDKGVSALFKDL